MLSVIIPTYKESERLNKTLTEIIPHLQNKYTSFEIIIVDDPDENGNYTKLNDCYKKDERIIFVRQEQRFGKGAAVKKGCLLGNKEFIMFIDADHSTKIYELENFIPQLNKNQFSIAVGARVPSENEPLHRRILSLASMLLMHLIIFKKTVIDSQCGFKVFPQKIVKEFFPLLKTKGGMVDVEILFLMQKNDIPISYVPVKWENSSDSRIDILSCIIRDPIDILLMKVRDLLGMYK